MSLIVYLTHDDAGNDCYVLPLPSRHFLAMHTQDTDEALRKLAQDFARFFTNPEEDADDAKIVTTTYPMMDCAWELRHVPCSALDLCRGFRVDNYRLVRRGNCLVGDNIVQDGTP